MQCRHDAFQLPPLELIVSLAQAGHAPASFVRYPTDQRHRSWRMMSPHGAFWLKLESIASPVAGIGREVSATRSLANHFSYLAPIVLDGVSAHGSPFLLAREVPGSPASSTRTGTGWTSAVAGELQSFSAKSEYWLDRDQWDGEDLFGARPDLGALLTTALSRTVDQDLGRFGARLVAALEPEPSVLIHGSFDPGNVIVHGSRLSAFIDLEAVRLGHASYDIASMASGLATEVSLDSAKSWLGACARIFGRRLNPVGIAGYICLRTLYREDADALSLEDRSSLMEVMHTARDLTSD